MIKHRSRFFALSAVLGALLVVTADSIGQRAPTQPLAVNPGQSATLLPDGRWLLLGGQADDNSGAASQAVLVDASGARREILATGLAIPRSGHTATVVPDGSVLVVGGIDRAGQPVSSIERFRPDTRTFEALGDFGLEARSGQTATLLTDGQLLLAGGTDVTTLVHADAQSFDAGTLRVGSTVPMRGPRTGQQAQLLPSGEVLLTGGRDRTGAAPSSAEVYRPSSGRFESVTAPAAAALTAAANNSAVPRIMEASPPADSEVSVGVRFALRFSKALAPQSLTDESVTLFGPSGPTDATVVAAEGGRLLFVTPKQSLLPDSRYTLFVNGARDPAGRALPFTALAFRTETLAPSPTPGSIETALTSQQALDDNDGELWIPRAQNLTGSWRSGGGFDARRSPQLRDGPLPTAPPGVTAVAGRVKRLNGAPLANVTLSISGRSVRTDANGVFLLAQIPAGTRTLVIDGGTANVGQRRYGRYEYKADVENGKTNALPFVIWMTRLDTRNAVLVPSPTTTETVVTNPRIPGLELRIPAGTVIRDSLGNNVTEITMTAIPVDQPPFPLPNRQVPVYFTVQPGGAHLQGLTVESARGARLIYPNFTRARTGERIDFWNYDPRAKGWYIYGQGSVSADERQIVPDPGVAIYEFTGAMIALPSAAPAEGPSSGCSSGGGKSVNKGVKAGDPVDCFTGLFTHERVDLAVNDVFPLEVRRTYRPRDSTSRSFGIGTSMSYDLFLIGDMNPYTYQELILPDGSRVHYTRTSPGTEWTQAVYEATTTPGPFFGSVLRYNTAINSGWLLTLNDGSVYTFADAPGSSVGKCGGLLGMRDRYGNVVTITRTGCNVTSVVSPNNRKITFTYDTSNRITQATDHTGRTALYHYDAQGRLDKATDPDGEFETYTYDSSHRMLAVTDKRGNAMVTNEYDANGRVTQQTYADSTTASFAYTLNGSNVVTQTDFTNERGIVKRVQFNAAGLPTSVVHALGTADEQAITYSRSVTTNLADTVTDALGRVTKFQYDAKGNVTQITRLYGTPNANAWTFTYEPTFNRQTSATDPSNHTTTFQYDYLGNLVSSTDALGHVTSITYNSAGQIKTVTRTIGGNPRTVTLDYTAGVLSSVTDALNRTTTFFTDSLGRTTAVKNPRGDVSQMIYDVMDRLVQSIDPVGNTLQYTYDANGNLLTFSDARDHDTTFTYDTRNRLTTVTDPLSLVEAYEYSDTGLPVRVTDRKGQVSGLEYDALDRVTSAGFGGTVASPTAYSSTIAYTWDDGDRLTQAVDSAAGTIGLTFDGLDRLLQEQNPQGQVDYTYYASGLRETMTVPGQGTVSYSYDANDRLTQIAHPSANVGFTYDDLDRPATVTLPNGVQASYAYDDGGQLTGITYENGATALGDITYGYDAAGRRVSVGGTLAQGALPAAVSSASYDAANRLTSWGSETLDYDDNGNLVSAGSSTYSWNARDELVGTSAGAGTFAYDAFGRRTSRTVGGSTATYLHDGLNPVVADGEFWLSGLGLDERYARIAGTAVTSVLTDALGSTVALSDAAGATTASFAYEPYGAATKTGTADTAFRFTGREDDGATGLQYFRSRYYSAERGRFISSDPIGLAGGANTYAYVNGDPAGANDPLGLAFTSVDWACAKDPMFCAEIMGQMVRSNAAVRGDPCAMEAADALSGAMMTMATVATVATIVSVVPRAAAPRGTGISVLGRNPMHKVLGDQIPSRFLDIPPAIWAKMSRAEQWAANERFLERLVARGDEVYLATNASQAVGGSFFARELKYLLDRGYTLVDDGWRLLPPR